MMSLPAAWWLKTFTVPIISCFLCAGIQHGITSVPQCPAHHLLWPSQTALALSTLVYKAKHKAVFLQSRSNWNTSALNSADVCSGRCLETWAALCRPPSLPWSRPCRHTSLSYNTLEQHRGKYSRLKKAPSPPELFFILASNLAEPFKSKASSVSDWNGTLENLVGVCWSAQ